MPTKEEIPCRAGILIWIAVLLFLGHGLSAQQVAAPRSADVSKSGFEIFMTNIPGILTGLAGILAAGMGWRDSRRKIDDLRLKLIDKRNLELIAINGEFLTKTRKNDFESFLRDVLCNETFTVSIPLSGRVKQAEVALQTHDEKIFDLESTVDPAELQRRRMARVMPLLGVLQKEGVK